MRKITMLLATAAMAIAFSGNGTAQDEKKKARPDQGPGAGRGGMIGGGFGSGVHMFLATNKDLQSELKITDDQKTKLEAVQKEQMAKLREGGGFGGGRGKDMTDEERKAAAEKREKAAAENKKAYEAVLNADQVKRLTQIGYQYMNVRAFSDKEVQSALKMTDEQKEKVKTVMETYQKDMMELRGGGRPGAGGGGGFGRVSEETQKKLDALKKETEEKIASAMTDDQKKMWKDMIGEKFDVSKLTFQAPRNRDN